MSERKVLVVVVMSMVQLLQCLHQGVEAAGPSKLVLYAHESTLPPTNTLIGSAAPNGNLTDEQFGLIKTISNTLRKTTSSESEVIGSQVGIVVLGKDVLNIYISFTYYLGNASGFGASTIAVHGHIDTTSIGNRVYAVVGGTGEFLSVTGQDVAAYVSDELEDYAKALLHSGQTGKASREPEVK